jgi:hypothetical protein
MASRNDLVYDEDDYVPPGYVPPKPSSRTKPLVAVVIVGLVIGALAVAFLMRSRERTRFARLERSRAEQAAAAARMATRPPGAGEEVGSRRRSVNWEKIVGSWSRVAGPDDEVHYPIRFDFREGPSTITLGNNRILEVNVYVRREDHESIVLEAQPRVIAEGRDVSFFHFKFNSDDSIVLNDSMGGLVYTREVANPARLGMPRR